MSNPNSSNQASGMMKELKERLELVGKVRTIVSTLVSTVIGAFPVWLTSSRSLQYVIAAGGVFGAALGFFLVPLSASKSNKPRKYWVFMGLGLVIAITEMTVMSVANSWSPGLIRDLQDFLISNPQVSNSIIFISATAISYSIASLVCMAGVINSGGKSSPSSIPSPPSPPTAGT